MKNDSRLPFKVGELAEAMTFEEGFRGAWFRCKIRGIAKRAGRLVHVLEYYDFPEEKLERLRLYQVPPYAVENAKEKHYELMLRPHYPRIYNNNQIPHISEISEVTVVIDNSWKVGDLVDWWSHDCHWSGRIKQLLGNDAAKIELNPPPLGEGSDYDVLLKDLRPSLEWSPEHGWTVPTQEGPCARLIKPINQDIGRNRNGPKTDAAVEASLGSSARSSQCPAGSSNSTISSEVKSMRTTKRLKRSLVSKELGDEEQNSSTGSGAGRKGKTGRAEEELQSNNSEVYEAKEGFCLDSKWSDTPEAAVVELEKTVNKLKQLKRILQYGVSTAESEKPQWEFVGHKYM